MNLSEIDFQVVDELKSKYDLSTEQSLKIYSDVDNYLNRKHKLKTRLLAEAAGKEPHYFYQFDGSANAVEDSLFQPDQDGDVLINAGATWELKNCTNEVRVLIHEDANPEAVIRLLNKIVEHIAQDPGQLNKESGKENLMSQRDEEPIPF